MCVRGARPDAGRACERLRQGADLHVDKAVRERLAAHACERLRSPLNSKDCEAICVLLRLFSRVKKYANLFYAHVAIH